MLFKMYEYNESSNIFTSQGTNVISYSELLILCSSRLILTLQHLTVMLDANNKTSMNI